VIIVTGGTGFIGNLVHELNRAGGRDILVVDNLAPAPNLGGPKFLNLAGAEFADYLDKKESRAGFKSGDSRMNPAVRFCTWAPVFQRLRPTGAAQGTHGQCDPSLHPATEGLSNDPDV